MNKELLLYTPIWSYTAEALIQAISDYPLDEDLTLRVCSPGGSPIAGWGIIAKMQERTGKTTIKVDGQADSMALYCLPFADYVECLDTTKPMVLHRADMEIESEEDMQLLNNINASLRAKMESVISADTLQRVKGVTFDDIFSMENRLDVSLKPEEAKALGLVHKITTLNPKEMQSLSVKLINCMTSPTEKKPLKKGLAPIISTETNLNLNKMNIDKLKAEFTEVYKEVLALGINQERERVKSFSAFIDADKETVIKAISEGSDFTPSTQNELMIKFQAHTLKAANIKSSTEKELGTGGAPNEDEAVLTEKEKEVVAMESRIEEKLKSQFKIK